GHWDREWIGVEQELVGIAAQAARRVEGTVRAVAVELTRPDARHPDVPVVIRAVAVAMERDYAAGARVVALEQQQLHEGRVSREDAEVHAAALGRGAERGAAASPAAVGAHAPPRAVRALTGADPARPADIDRFGRAP